MKRVAFAALMGLIVSGASCAAQPDETIVKSCLQAQAIAPSVTIQSLNTGEITQDDKYVDGFHALYMFEYRGSDVGYAESKEDQALIYLGKLYRLSKAVPFGNNRGIKHSAINPTLAQWSIARENNKKYFCVSFNFDGLGRSGDFQNVHGGYLLDTATKFLYFVVRDIRNLYINFFTNSH
ncbi:hypothetical protein [Paraburkholderia sp. SIMBA_030]|uniref:hypothetical protein n=1 Tax=Paraburkholderia sp. SIMBA_030 TaxID=3085773 RepID=UPI0039790CE0